MSNEMIDRVAKALWDNHQSQPYVRYGISNQLLFGKTNGEVVTLEEIISVNVVCVFADEYREKAKVAIAAMREPTLEMLKAGALFNPKENSLEGYNRAKDDAKISWQAMIDKILES